jgi:hypothetical protein
MSYPCPYCEGLPRQPICSSSTNLEKHIKFYHGCKAGQAKHLCKECSNENISIYFPTTTYFAHVFAKGHYRKDIVQENVGEEEEEREEQLPTSTVTPSLTVTPSRRGTAGRAVEVSYMFDEKRLPIMNDYFPFSNATEEMIYLYNHVFRPSQDGMRTMQAMVGHPEFKVKDWPGEKELDQMTELLPLLPMYKVEVDEGPPILMHSIIDWLKQLERNPKLTAQMHFGAEIVSSFLLWRNSF